ncbi:hypothetical protein M407DRAFT_52872, partial [Tulasnella calospora MUT 4182]
GKQITDSRLRSHLLSLDLSGTDKNLPGRLPLYEGMPVILWSHNIAPYLKVTNGAQGTLHRIFTKPDNHGNSVATCALVHFPNSPVRINGLPEGVYPILPQTWSFVTPLPSTDTSKVSGHRVSRKQLPIQPAFAVTGHCAQGKMLNSVVFDL